MKNDLRREVARRIGKLSAREKKRAAEELSAQIGRLEEYSSARVVLGFWPLDDEIDVRPVLRDALGAKKTVALPVAVVETGEMRLRRFRGEEALVEGAYGILEPFPDEEELRPAAVGLVLVPGRAFDHSGNRLGRGKGYYDRFLASLGERVFRLGVAYEAQVFERVPACEKDVPVHALATERGVKRCGQGSS